MLQRLVHLSRSEPISNSSASGIGSGMELLFASGQWDLRGFLRMSGKVLCYYSGRAFGNDHFCTFLALDEKAYNPMIVSYSHEGEPVLN